MNSKIIWFVRWLGLPWLGLWIMVHSAFGQFGGESPFQFLYLSPAASITALGENTVAHSFQDPSLAWFNPASLRGEDSHQSMSFQHQFMFQGIQNGYAAYAHHLPQWNLHLHAGIKYVDYGDFVETDLFGQQIGNFSANELAFVIGGSYAVNERVSFGLNTKYIGSYLESYTASALAMDLGAQYRDEEARLQVGIALQNAGFGLKSYVPGQQVQVPYNLVVGFNKRLEHVPFRLGIHAHSLQYPSMRYESPFTRVTTLFGDAPSPTPPFNRFMDNVFRHLLFSGEFLLGEDENFTLRFAYNHLRRKELQVFDFRSLTGFSGGLGLKMGPFQFSYAYSVYHLAGGVHHLGLGSRLSYFKKKNPLTD
jgi:hypothetical protein